MYHYIENLTAVSWTLHVLPYFLRRKWNKDEPVHLLYYVNHSRWGLLLARLTLWSIKAKLEPLNFCWFDVRDPNGDLMWWKVEYEDSIAVQEEIKNHPEFQKIIREFGKALRLPLFLMRRIMYFDWTGKDINLLLKTIFFIHVVIWKHGDKNQNPVNIFFLSFQRPWLVAVGRWAAKRNINIIPLGGINLKILKKMVLQLDEIKSPIKQIAYYFMVIKHRFRRIRFSKNAADTSKTAQKNAPDFRANSPKIAVEYLGQLNLYSSELASDLFFCRQSNISKPDILVYFRHPKFLATDKMWHEIKKYGMAAVAVNSRAAATPHIPLFNYRGRKLKIRYSKDIATDKNDLLIRKSLYRQVADYYKEYDYWKTFILRNNIKIHVSWYDFDAESCALFDALEDTGGIGVDYQRSFWNLPDPPWTTLKGGVVFGFSKYGAHIGQDNDSIMPYYIVTGYLTDYRFSFVRGEANNVRNHLQSNGAKRIITYFDENSVGDSRWEIGHEVTKENYKYLLNKLLKTPWLGLIFKPKKFLHLHKRLGNDIFQLLQCAEKTGRCFVFKEGGLTVSNPPAIAAMAADIAIHGHFFAATAGIEAALTGTPTIMLDREGFSKSPLYKLGVGRVIFKTWDELWTACQDHWNAPNGVPGFGDWSPVIDDLDPFRDGRAAERMGTYIGWLMEGFKAKLPRETILADAAERYSKIWGKDKIFFPNSKKVTRSTASLEDDVNGKIARVI